MIAITAFQALALIANVQQSSVIEFTEPPYPDYVVHTVEARCGFDQYRIVYAHGPHLRKNYISEISHNGASVHDRELSKIIAVLPHRDSLQEVAFRACVSKGQRGIEFEVRVPPAKRDKPILENIQFRLVGGQISRIRD